MPTDVVNLDALIPREDLAIINTLEGLLRPAARMDRPAGILAGRRKKANRKN